MVHAFNPSTYKAGGSELEASTVYREFRTAEATEKPVLKNKKTNKQKAKQPGMVVYRQHRGG